jgi:hypothetical protein
VPKGSIISATAKAQVADISKRLAIFQHRTEGNTSAYQNFSSAQARFDKASTEFAAYKKAHPNDMDCDKLATICAEQGQNCQLRKFGAMADLVTKNKLGSKSFEASLLLRDLNEVQQKIEQQQQQSLSGSSAFRLATVNWLSARITEGTAKADHYSKAEAELKKSFNLFSQEGRRAESANVAIALRDLYKEGGRPEKFAQLQN